VSMLLISPSALYVSFFFFFSENTRIPQKIFRFVSRSGVFLCTRPGIIG
jgi:hypothetical protein